MSYSKQPFLYHTAFFITVGTFLTPLLVDLSSYVFPFIVLKVFVFRSLVALLAGVYVLLWYKYPSRFRPYMSAIHGAILAFWFVYLLTTANALDVRRALWDNHERMLGFVTVTHVVLYAFLVSWIFRTKEELQRLWRYFLLAGAAVMLVGMRQKYGDDPFLMSQGGRVYGTLGNPIYFSAYGLFLFFSGLLCTYWDRRHRMWRVVCALAGLLGFLGIFWGGTRGTILGLICGVSVAVFLYGVYNPTPTHRKYAWGVMAVGACVLASLFFFRETAIVQSLPGIERLVNTSLSLDTSDTRLMAWGVGLEAWMVKPILGWGPNGFFFAFNQYFNPRFLSYGYGETWFDNAHNVVVNTLTTQGVVGVIVYLGLFITVAISIWRIHRNDATELFTAVCFLGFLVGHFVNNLFVFESPTSYMYVFFFMACVGVWSVSTQQRVGDVSGQKQHNRMIPVGLLGAVGVVVCLVILVININPARANAGSLRVMRLMNQQNWMQARDAYEYVISIPTPHRDDIRNDITRSVISALGNNTVAASVPKEIRDLFMQDAYEHIKRNLAEYPYDIRHHLMFFQMTQSLLPLHTDQEVLLRQSQEYIEQALVLSPKRQQLLFSYGSILAQLGNFEGGVRAYQTAIDVESTVVESWRQYLRFLQVTQQLDTYEEVLNKAIQQQVLTEEDAQMLRSALETK